MPNKAGSSSRVRPNAGRLSARTGRRAGLRLYASVWEQVEEHYYDRSRLVTWRRWSKKYDDKIRDVADGLRYVDKMLADLDDPHTTVFAPHVLAYLNRQDVHSFGGVGADLRIFGNGVFLIGTVISGSPAHHAGLKKDDLILRVGRRQAQHIAPLDLTPMIRGAIGTTVTITVQRGKHEHTFRMRRKRIHKPAVHARVLDNGVGYLRIMNFSQPGLVKDVRRALRKELAGCPGIIIDLRDNGGGDNHQALSTASLFLDKGRLATYQRRGRSGTQTIAVSLKDNALVHAIHTGTRTRKRYRRTARVLPMETPVAILVDGESASGAELLASALRDNGRAILIGQRTYGKGIAQKRVKLKDGFLLHVSHWKYFTASGHWPGDAHKQRRGLRPDIVVKSKARIFRSGYDSDKQLQAACKYVLESAAPR